MQTIESDIKKGEFRPVYVLYGEEAYLKDQYKKKLKEAILPNQDLTNFNQFTGKGTDPLQIIELADTLPFFAAHRLILIEESGFFKTASPKLADYLPQMPEETILVFVEEGVSKNNRLYKAAVSCGGHFAEMKRQNEKTLRTWVIRRVKKDGKKIGARAYAQFREKSGNDMENMNQELEKLLAYCADHEEITAEDVSAVCCGNTEDQVFQMIRSITERQQKKALDLYYDLVALKKKPLSILFLLARQYNQMLQAKDLNALGYGTEQTAKQMGVSPYAVKNILREAAHYPREALRLAVEKCVKAEEDVKSGLLADRLAVEMLIIELSETPSP